MFVEWFPHAAMGEHGVYVWSAVSVVVLMMLVQVKMSLKSFKRIKQQIGWKHHGPQS